MKNKRTLKIGFILILIAASFFVWRKQRRKSGQERFKTVAVERGSIRITVQATGTTMPQNRLELKPPISGRIESIGVQEGEKVEKGEILAWLSSTERAALLDAARAKGKKELAYWEEVYKPTPLVSPMNGVIIARNMEPGQTVTAQDIPLVMSDRLIVKAQVDETDIGQLQLGQQAELVLDAYPGRRIPGKISHIAYESKTVNNVTMYEVELLPESVPPYMRAGMTANVLFLVREKADVLILPEEAVRKTDGEESVLVPSDQTKKKRRGEKKTVETGLSDGKRIEIVSGLSEGEAVLVPEMRLDKAGGQRTGGGNPFSPFGGGRTGGRAAGTGQR
jgi:macrolide-specific efflux system membrane fusion protein